MFFLTYKTQFALLSIASLSLGTFSLSCNDILRRQRQPLLGIYHSRRARFIPVSAAQNVSHYGGGPWSSDTHLRRWLGHGRPTKITSTSQLVAMSHGEQSSRLLADLYLIHETLEAISAAFDLYSAPSHRPYWSVASQINGPDHASVWIRDNVLVSGQRWETTMPALCSNSNKYHSEFQRLRPK